VCGDNVIGIVPLDGDHCCTRHGDTSGHFRIVAVAVAVVWSRWHVVHGFGTHETIIVFDPRFYEPPIGSDVFQERVRVRGLERAVGR